MTPKHQLLLDQVVGCRQLALIAEPANAAELRKLADDYDAEALLDNSIMTPKPPAPTVMNHLPEAHVRSVSRGNSWDDALYDFRRRAEELPEGPQKTEMLAKARRLEHAIAFRARLGSSHGQAKG